MKFFMDGDAAFPTICGTGTEDYFGGAWGFVRNIGSVETERSYNAPYLGHRFLNQDIPQLNNSFLDRSIPMHSFYRWHILDPIRFASDLRVTLQQIGIDDQARLFERQDDVSSVAYWYQTEPHELFPLLPDRDARMPR